MSSHNRGKPPRSVIAAVVIFLIPVALAAIAAVTFVVVAIVEGEAGMAGLAVLMLFGALIPGMVAQGLWRGYRGARIMAMIIGVLALPSGLVLLILLTTRTAKQWFGLPVTATVEFPRSQ